MGVQTMAAATRVARFAASGTWTVPSGVTYAVAHCLGGGGGIGNVYPAGGTYGTDGGASAVYFPSDTVVSPGGIKFFNGTANQSAFFLTSQANSGKGGRTQSYAQTGGDAEWVSGGAAVAPGAAVTVTVGAGGADGGGSGYVWIEY